MTSRIYRVALVALAAVWLSATVARANLGTVTAGTISGTTISGATITGGTLTAGSGSEVFIDSHGLTLEAGNTAANEVKWDDGSFIYSTGGGMLIHAPSGVVIGAGSASPLIIDDDQVLPQVPMKFDDGVTSPITAEALAWHSGNQYVCVNSSGTFFPSAFACN